MSEDNLSKFNSQKISNGDYPYNGKILLAAVVLLSVVVFLVFLLHIYARWLLRCRSAAARHLPREPHRHNYHRSRSSLPTIFPSIIVEARLSVDGVDAKALALLPVFVHRAEQLESDLECVVCLGEMEDGEMGRLLPICGHVFHVACVDMWLASHSTCPICRAEVKLEAAVAALADLEADGASPSTMAAPVTDQGEGVVGVDDSGNMANEETTINSAALLMERNEAEVDSPVNSAATIQREKENDRSSISSFSSSSSSSSTAAATNNTATSTSSSCGPSLKRILSRGFLSQ